MRKIVITNVYCYKNKGDAGIVFSMIDNLKKINPNIQIYLMSLWSDLDQGKYGRDIKVIPPVYKVNNIKNNYLKFLINLIILIFKPFLYRLGIFNKSERIIKNADLIISCGGGYMQCRSFKEFLSGFIYHYLQLYCAYFFHKRYYIFAQTIGPFNSFSKRISKKILNNAEKVLPREPLSLQYVKRNFSMCRTILTSDVAFLLKRTPIEFQFDKDQVNVGVTVRHWLYPGENREQCEENYISSILLFVSQLQEEGNYEIYFMIQCTGPLNDNDLIITKEIIKRLKNKHHVHLVKKDLNPKELKYIYSKMDFFVGTRMHSNIFALSEGVPCLAISYDYKTDGIMKEFGLGKYVLDINNITASSLIKKFEILINDKDIRYQINNKLILIRKLANKNFKILRNDIQ